MSDIIKTIEYKGFRAEVIAEPLYYENPLEHDEYWQHLNFFASHRDYDIGQKKYRNLYSKKDFDCLGDAVDTMKQSHEYVYHTFIGCNAGRYSINLKRLTDSWATNNNFTGFIWITGEQYNQIKELYRGVEGLDLRKVEQVCDRYVDDMLREYLTYINGITQPTCYGLSHATVTGFEHYIGDRTEWGELEGEAFELEIHKYIDDNLATLQIDLDKAVDQDIEQLKRYKLVA